MAHDSRIASFALSQDGRLIMTVVYNCGARNSILVYNSIELKLVLHIDLKSNPKGLCAIS